MADPVASSAKRETVQCETQTGRGGDVCVCVCEGKCITHTRSSLSLWTLRFLQLPDCVDGETVGVCVSVCMLHTLSPRVVHM